MLLALHLLSVQQLLTERVKSHVCSAAAVTSEQTDQTYFIEHVVVAGDCAESAGGDGIKTESTGAPVCGSNILGSNYCIFEIVGWKTGAETGGRDERPERRD